MFRVYIHILMALLFGGVVFAMLMLLFLPEVDLIYVTIMALCAGVSFSLGMYLYANSSRIKAQTALSEDEQQGLICSEGANLSMESKSVSGQLYLTVENLIFEPHNFNLHRSVLKIPVSNIAGAESNEESIFPAGLLVQLKDAGKVCFLVADPQKWITQIKEIS